MGDWSEEIAGEERVSDPVHRGEVLKQKWFDPLGMNTNQFAKALAVDRRNVCEIVGGKRGISADMALRLARWSDMRASFGLGLQADYDFRMAEWRRGEEIAEQVQRVARRDFELLDALTARQVSDGLRRLNSGAFGPARDGSAGS